MGNPTFTPLPSLRIFKHGLALLLLAFCIGMISGCASSSMGAIDKQTSDLIRQHWAQSMGHEASEQMYGKPISDAPDDEGRNVDKTDLKTTNPQVNQLPARTRSATDPDELGKLFSDDMSNALEMDLQELLAYAIANSRQYR